MSEAPRAGLHPLVAMVGGGRAEPDFTGGAEGAPAGWASDSDLPPAPGRGALRAAQHDSVVQTGWWAGILEPGQC